MSYKFELLRGLHNAGDLVYEPGDVFESPADLLGLGTDRSRVLRFRRASDDATVSPGKRIDALTQSINHRRLHTAQPPQPQPEVGGNQTGPQSATAVAEASDDRLDAMSVEELRKLADDLDLNMSKGARKVELLASLREATK